MGKKVRVAMHGRQSRSILVDSDATEGATIGKNLRKADGTLVTEAQIINQTVDQVATVNPGTVSTGSSIWSLILEIPTIIKNLAALTATGIIRHVGAGVLSANDWPTVKNSIDAGEAFTIPTGQQMLVWGEFTFNGGALTLDGDLVIL